jgi:hypothetical protein
MAPRATIIMSGKVDVTERFPRIEGSTPLVSDRKIAASLHDVGVRM